nr:hypothetical protein OHA15_40425 [Streptomyces anthocyanicus]
MMTIADLERLEAERGSDGSKPAGSKPAPGQPKSKMMTIADLERLEAERGSDGSKPAGSKPAPGQPKSKMMTIADLERLEAERGSDGSKPAGSKPAPGQPKSKMMTIADLERLEAERGSDGSKPAGSKPAPGQPKSKMMTIADLERLEAERGSDGSKPADSKSGPGQPKSNVRSFGDLKREETAGDGAGGSKPADSKPAPGQPKSKMMTIADLPKDPPRHTPGKGSGGASRGGGYVSGGGSSGGSSGGGTGFPARPGYARLGPTWNRGDSTFTQVMHEESTPGPQNDAHRMQDAEDAAVGGQDAEGTAVGGQDAEGAAVGGQDAEGTAVGGQDAEGTAVGGHDAEGTAVGRPDADEVTVTPDAETISSDHQDTSPVPERQAEATPAEATVSVTSQTDSPLVQGGAEHQQSAVPELLTRPAERGGAVRTRAGLQTEEAGAATVSRDGDVILADHQDVQPAPGRGTETPDDLQTTATLTGTVPSTETVLPGSGDGHAQTVVSEAPTPAAEHTAVHETAAVTEGAHAPTPESVDRPHDTETALPSTESATVPSKVSPPTPPRTPAELRLDAARLDIDAARQLLDDKTLLESEIAQAAVQSAAILAVRWHEVQPFADPWGAAPLVAHPTEGPIGIDYTPRWYEAQQLEDPQDVARLLPHRTEGPIGIGDILRWWYEAQHLADPQDVAPLLPDLTRGPVDNGYTRAMDLVSAQVVQHGPFTGSATASAILPGPVRAADRPLVLFGSADPVTNSLTLGSHQVSLPDLENWLSTNTAWESGDLIVLVVPAAAALGEHGGPSLAQQVADLLDSPVLAPDSALYVDREARLVTTGPQGWIENLPYRDPVVRSPELGQSLFSRVPAEPVAVPGRKIGPPVVPEGRTELVARLELDAALLDSLPEDIVTPGRVRAARRLMWRKNIELPPLPGGSSHAPAHLLFTLQQALVMTRLVQGRAAAENLATQARDTLDLTAPHIPVPGGSHGADTDTDSGTDSDDSLFSSSPRHSPELTPPPAELALPIAGLALPGLGPFPSLPGSPETVEQAAAGTSAARREPTVLDVDGYISERPSAEAVAALGNEAFLPWHVAHQVQIPWARGEKAPARLSLEQIEDLFHTTLANPTASLGGVWDHVNATHGVRLVIEDLRRIHQHYHALGESTPRGRVHLGLMMFLEAARQYAANHGGSIADVPFGHSETVNGTVVRLGNWMARLRRDSSGLDDAVRAALDRLGMRWVSQPYRRNDRYLAAARQYAANHGGSIADVAFNRREEVDGSELALGHWIHKVRGGEREVDTEDRAELDSMNMRWAAPRHEDYIAAARQYAELHGGFIADVPREHVEWVNGREIPLDFWLRKVSKGRVKVNPETRAALNAMRMRASRRDSVAAARQYAERHGGSLAHISEDHVESVNGIEVQLGAWLHDLSSGAVRVDRVTRAVLDALHLRKHSPIAVLLAAARQYAANHGGSIADVPDDHVEPVDGHEVHLGDWLRRVRGDNKGMKKEVRAVLNELHMRWKTARKIASSTYLAAARQYAANHGGSIADLPPDHVEPVDGYEVPLGSWVHRRLSRVDEATLASVYELGKADLRDSRTSKYLAAALQYAARSSDGSIAEVPHSQPEVVNGQTVQLGHWISNVRRGRTTVDENARALLNVLGMRWESRGRGSRYRSGPYARAGATGTGRVTRRGSRNAAAVPSSAAAPSQVAPAAAPSAGPSVASSLVTLAARHGLRMESVPADGDCFVTSFARVLEVIEGRAWTGAQVREGIAGALREDLLLVPDERRLWPALEPVVLQHTAESMLGRVNEAVAAVVSWQERVNRAVAGLLQSGGVTDTHRRAFAELIGQPRQWMSSAGDAMPQIATLLWNVQIQVTQVAVPAWGGPAQGPRVSRFPVGDGERVVHMVRSFQIEAGGRPAGEHWSPAFVDPRLVAQVNEAAERQAVNEVLRTRLYAEFQRELTLAVERGDLRAHLVLGGSQEQFESWLWGQVEHARALWPVSGEDEMAAVRQMFASGVHAPVGQFADHVADSLSRLRGAQRHRANEPGPVVMRAEIGDTAGLARSDLLTHFLTADNDARERILRALDSKGTTPADATAPAVAGRDEGPEEQRGSDPAVWVANANVSDSLIEGTLSVLESSLGEGQNSGALPTRHLMTLIRQLESLSAQMSPSQFEKFERLRAEAGTAVPGEHSPGSGVELTLEELMDDVAREAEHGPLGDFDLDVETLVDDDTYSGAWITAPLELPVKARPEIEPHSVWDDDEQEAPVSNDEPGALPADDAVHAQPPAETAGSAEEAVDPAEREGLAAFVKAMEPLKSYAQNATDRTSTDVEVVLVAYPGAASVADFYNSPKLGHAFLAVRIPGLDRAVTFGFGPAPDISELEIVTGTVRGEVAEVDPTAIFDSRAEVVESVRVNAEQLINGYLYAASNFDAMYNLLVNNCVIFAREFLAAVTGNTVMFDSIAPSTLIEEGRHGTHRDWVDHPRIVELMASDKGTWQDTQAWISENGYPEKLTWARYRTAIDHHRPLIVDKANPTQVKQLQLLEAFTLMIAVRAQRSGAAAARKLSNDLGRRYGTSRAAVHDPLALVTESLDPLRSYAYAGDGTEEHAEVVIMSGADGQPAVAVKIPDVPDLVAFRFGKANDLPGSMRVEEAEGGLMIEHSDWIYTPSADVLGSYRINASQAVTAFLYAQSHHEGTYDIRNNAETFVHGFLTAVLGGDTQAFRLDAMRSRVDRSWSDSSSPVTTLSPEDQQALTRSRQWGSQSIDEIERSLMWARLRVAVDHQRPLVKETPTPEEKEKLGLLESFVSLIADTYRSVDETAALDVSRRLGRDYGTWRWLDSETSRSGDARMSVPSTAVEGESEQIASRPADLSGETGPAETAVAGQSATVPRPAGPEPVVETPVARPPVIETPVRPGGDTVGTKDNPIRFDGEDPAIVALLGDVLEPENAERNKSAEGAMVKAVSAYIGARLAEAGMDQSPSTVYVDLASFPGDADTWIARVFHGVPVERGHSVELLHPSGFQLSVCAPI